MYIEKISEQAKKSFIRNYVNELNTNYWGCLKDEDDDSFLRIKKYDERDLSNLQARGLLKVISNLKNKGIFFNIYQNYSEDYCHRYSHQYAIIAKFSDFSVEVYKTKVGCRDFYHTCVENMIEFLAKNNKLDNKRNPLSTNLNYIKEFMLPNLNQIDNEAGSNLVNEYKEDLKQIFNKKEQLVSQRFQNQRNDLGIDQ